jgi:hypothetical protein
VINLKDKDLLAEAALTQNDYLAVYFYNISKEITVDTHNLVPRDFITIIPSKKPFFEISLKEIFEGLHNKALANCHSEEFTITNSMFDKNNKLLKDAELKANEYSIVAMKTDANLFNDSATVDAAAELINTYCKFFLNNKEEIDSKKLFPITSKESADLEKKTATESTEDYTKSLLDLLFEADDKSAVAPTSFGWYLNYNFNVGEKAKTKNSPISWIGQILGKKFEEVKKTAKEAWDAIKDVDVYVGSSTGNFKVGSATELVANVTKGVFNTLIKGLARFNSNKGNEFLQRVNKYLRRSFKNIKEIFVSCKSPNDTFTYLKQYGIVPSAETKKYIGDVENNGGCFILRVTSNDPNYNSINKQYILKCTNSSLSLPSVVKFFENLFKNTKYSSKGFLKVKIEDIFEFKETKKNSIYDSLDSTKDLLKKLFLTEASIDIDTFFDNIFKKEKEYKEIDNKILEIRKTSPLSHADLLSNNKKYKDLCIKKRDIDDKISDLKTQFQKEFGKSYEEYKREKKEADNKKLSVNSKIFVVPINLMQAVGDENQNKPEVDTKVPEKNKSYDKADLTNKDSGKFEEK